MMRFLSMADLVDLNVLPTIWENASPADALGELVANAVDAQYRAKLPTDLASMWKMEQGCLSIRNLGLPLKRTCFAMGKSSGAGKYGKYGIGLKEAVAVIMRYRGTVEIESGQSLFTFHLSKGTLGETTIHLLERSTGEPEPALVATVVKVVLAPDVLSLSLHSVAKMFLGLDSRSPSRKHICSVPLRSSGVEVRIYENSADIEAAYVNDRRVQTIGHTYYLVYNFVGDIDEVKKLDSRDHIAIDIAKVNSWIRSAFKDPASAPAREYILGELDISNDEEFERCLQLADLKLKEVRSAAGIDDLKKRRRASAAPVWSPPVHSITYAPPVVPVSYPSAPVVPSPQPTPAPRLDMPHFGLAVQSLLSALYRDNAPHQADAPALPAAAASTPVPTLAAALAAVSCGASTTFASVVEKVATALKAIPNLGVAETVLTGSYGRGTSVAMRHAASDVDIVVYMNNMPATGMDRTVTTLLVLMETGLKLQNAAGTFANFTRKRFSLQFDVTLPDQAPVSVDILPASAVYAALTLDKLKESLTKASPMDKRYLSCAFAKEQVKEIEKLYLALGSLEGTVRSLVRLVKTWRKAEKKWEDGCVPHKLCLELLMLRAAVEATPAGSPPGAAAGPILQQFWTLCKDLGRSVEVPDPATGCKLHAEFDPSQLRERAHEYSKDEEAFLAKLAPLLCE
eukprot:m.40320 g.40320  ORF g.40320 m.40320 type:complete len:683 (+) comp5605_c0_seq1:2051-4099(+)